MKRPIARLTTVLVATIMMAAVMTSAASATRTASTGSSRATADVTFAGAAEQSAGTAADCPYGSACLFEDPYGTSLMWVAPGCGWHELPRHLWDMARVGQTHGNPMMIYNLDGDWFVHVQTVHPWSKSTLVVPPNADAVYIVC